MKLKRSLLLAIMTLFTLMSASSHAGRQGVSYYYGVGLGIIAPSNADIAPAGNILLGFEEDGWALEAIAYTSIETGTDDPTNDYSVNGTHIGLAYRTAEKNNNWFKFKVSATKMIFDNSNKPTDTDTKGSSFTIGWGLRMSSNARLEIDYDYYNSNDFNDPVHIITGRYFWGGSVYTGRGF